MRHLATSILAVLALAVVGSAHAAPVPGQGTWETTLLGRDIDGHAVPITDPSAEFAYDTNLHATWYLTSNNTQLNWDDAKSWAAGLTVGTFSGWSLPPADERCIGYDCTGGQMGELDFTALGNPLHGLLVNTGPFKNLESYPYWTSTGAAPYPAVALYFNFYAVYGAQLVYYAYYDGFPHELAIRPGDVLASVPEPGTYAMLLAGFGLSAAMVRRRHRAHAAS